MSRWQPLSPEIGLNLHRNCFFRNMLHNIYRKGIAYLQNLYRARACKPRAYLNPPRLCTDLAWKQIPHAFVGPGPKLSSSNCNSRLPCTKSQGWHQSATQQSLVPLPRILYRSRILHATCCQEIDLEIEKMRRLTCRIHPKSQATSRTP